MHLSASHSATATNPPSEIHLTLFAVERSVPLHTVPPRSFCPLFAWQSASSFVGMPKCPRTKLIMTAMVWAQSALAYSVSALASCCPGPGSRCAVHLKPPCESLEAATVGSLCARSASALTTGCQSSTVNAQSSASNTSICPLTR